ncbi:MAG TPA: hypothetical protein VFR68_15520 [Candidatus Dormibacteraeota bacterium]|nr:hypothetical protein [Candidatus Dormibacteraeota bacterium]
MSRIPRRPIVLALTAAASIYALLRFGVGVTILVMAIGVTAAILVGRHQAGLFAVRKKTQRAQQGPRWRPTVQHQELPPPTDDPVIAFAEPRPEDFTGRTPPLSHLQLSATTRSQLDGFALGRAKRIVEAPDLLPHAAADAESWPVVEAAVQRTLELARSRGTELNPEGQTSLQRALALSAAQGVLLAEWRQLEDGKTMWDGANARIRGSDAFAIQRITESMERQQLPDLFAGIARRPPNFEVRLLLPYALATAFYLRLQGNAPKAFAA